MKSLSHVQLFVTPWTVAYYTSPSMGFSMQEYWSGLPFPSPEDLPNPGIKLRSSGSPALAGRFFLPLSHQGTPMASIMSFKLPYTDIFWTLPTLLILLTLSLNNVH